MVKIFIMHVSWLKDIVTSVSPSLKDSHSSVMREKKFWFILIMPDMRFFLLILYKFGYDLIQLAVWRRDSWSLPRGRERSTTWLPSIMTTPPP